MRKKVIRNLILIFTAAVALILISTYTASISGNSNKFNRYWFTSQPQLIEKLQPVGKESVYSLTGASGTTLFFSVDDPTKLLILNLISNNTRLITFPFNFTEKLLSGYDIYVDSPYLSLYSRNLSLKLKWSIDNFDFKSITNKQMIVPLYTRIAPLNDNSIVLRSFDNEKRTQLFQKINLSANQITKSIDLLSKNQTDAGFSTDGFLKYDSLTNRLIFMQIYTNAFYCLDTNLNLVYTAQTIDPNKNNSIKTRVFLNKEKKGSIMPSVPLNSVNKDFTIHDKSIFIISKVKADNEASETFSNNITIDKYNIENGNYEGSFHIPNIDGVKAHSIIMHKGMIVATYRGYIAMFSLPGFVNVDKPKS